jgi:Cytochrome c554 and c-prime
MMKPMTNNRRAAIAITLIGFSVTLLTMCVSSDNNNSEHGEKIEASQFAGSESCAGCHKNIYDSHIHTAHYLTTRPALKEYIKGSFEPGKNIYAYDSGRIVVMEKRDSGFYQVGYFEGRERIIRRFDIVVGSGSKGQTYITREQKQLYQLPVSYFTAANNWANSPLYPVYPVIFNRAITSRCLECHSTFAQVVSPPAQDSEDFDIRIIYGVDCEKCHGPAARHVAFQKENPKDTTGKFILNPARFTKQQNLDLCGLCHGGRLQKTRPSFEFVSGDKLSDFFQVDTTTPNPDNIDVHGNQYGLLRSSKCFKMSNIMTCTTCHNPHENERGKIALFSQRCISCHNSAHDKICKMTASIGPSISLNCVDCHMPLKPSRSITELLPGDKTPTAAMIRSHLIKIYPGAMMHEKSNPNKIN